MQNPIIGEESDRDDSPATMQNDIPDQYYDDYDAGLRLPPTSRRAGS